MKIHTLVPAILLALASQLPIAMPVYAGDHDHAEAAQHEDEVEKGPNNGRMLRQGNFALELALFERGVPPEFRVYASKNGEKIAANAVTLSIQLHRLGDIKDQIQFKPEGDYLRGDTVIYEPHSFVVEVNAVHDGQNYQWRYDNIEGRSEISEQMATAMAIATEQAGQQTLTESLEVFGQLALPPNGERHIQARFAGQIQELNVTLGQRVTKGQTLMTVEGNESLQPYAIKAPMSGVITSLDAGFGEQTGGRNLMTITDPSQLMAYLKVFSKDQNKVKTGAKVKLSLANWPTPIEAEIQDSLVSLASNQAKVFRAKIISPATTEPQQLSPGQFVKADIAVAQYQVPLAVKTSGLQGFRDFTVVYQKIGNQYEVRMLELGRRAGEWVEVLSGLTLGAEYVTENSYLIKADIDKSGASHDH